MFKGPDKQFTEALKQPELFERRLRRLIDVRKICTIGAIVLGLLAIAAYLLGVLGSQSMSPSSFYSFGMLIFLSCFNLINAGLAHSEVRTLLSFKELQDQAKSS